MSVELYTHMDESDLIYLRWGEVKNEETGDLLESVLDVFGNDDLAVGGVRRSHAIGLGGGQAIMGAFFDQTSHLCVR